MFSSGLEAVESLVEDKEVTYIFVESLLLLYVVGRWVIMCMYNFGYLDVEKPRACWKFSKDIKLIWDTWSIRDLPLLQRVSISAG